MFTGRRLAGRTLAVAGVAALGLSLTAAASAATAAPQAACTYKGAANWYPTGDKVEAEDFCPDGYAVRVSVYQLNRDQGGTYWKYTGIRATARSNGDSDTDAKNLVEGVRIRLHAYLVNSEGTKCHRNFYKTPDGDYLNSGNGQSTTYIYFKC